MLRTVILLIVSLIEVSGYMTFQARIPNGNRVPNPCHPEDVWPGVGHELIGGTGPRNPFGLDFFASNTAWTKELCEKDSDGDGIKNGAELGDPDCTWTQNSTPKSATNLSHPGVCEPVDSEKCMGKNAWLTCPKNFSCPAFNKPTTRSINMTIPRTVVPPNETTYMCHGFRMPNETKYHAIGLIPSIDNKEIMHHMLIFGCSQYPGDQMMNEAIPCSMGMQQCSTIIGLWSVGIHGECHPDAYGFPIGTSGFQYVVVQLHWNNPELRTGMTDSSGVIMYYTDQLRPNDAMVVMTGQQVLEIPPQRQSVIQQGTCTSSCTKYIQPPKVNISAAILHMHLLGKAGSIEHMRDGKVITTLVKEDAYDYNSPVTYTYNTPYEMRAGDEIKVTCEYQSMKRNKTVYWGEGTQDEMCYGFITIYPAVEGFDFCGEVKNLGQCSMPQFNFYSENGCNINDFNSLLGPIATHCAMRNCSKVCMALMNGLYETGCLQGVIWDFIKEYWVQFSAEFKAMLPLIENCWPRSSMNSTSIAPAVSSTLSNNVVTTNNELPGCGQPQVNTSSSVYSQSAIISIIIASFAWKIFSR